jgi:hypothetical protein
MTPLAYVMTIGIVLRIITRLVITIVKQVIKGIIIRRHNNYHRSRNRNHLQVAELSQEESAKVSRELSKHELKRVAFRIASDLGFHPGAAKAMVFALYHEAKLRPCDVWVRRQEFGLENIEKATLYRYHQQYKSFVSIGFI